MGSEMVMDRLPGVDSTHTPRRPQHIDGTEPFRRAQNQTLLQVQCNEPKRNQSEQVQRFAGLGIGLASVFAENVLSHPSIVLRRQCQVHHHSQRFHLTPFTLMAVLWRIQMNQSFTTMWKGVGSVFVVRGIGLASEAAISEFTPFPKEVNRHSSLKKLGQHLLLKGSSLLIMTPFSAASLVETVQSDIASERPGLVDCVKEGCMRLVGVGTPQTTRILPVWKFVVPSVSYGLMHYVITSVAQYTLLMTMKNEEQDDLEQGDTPATQSISDTYFPELLATFTGNLVADVMLYPLETILHRLLIQGTRTIIDDTDSGLGVIPINTKYEGFIDCLKTVITEEGLAGLYKGFGALLLQYTLHAAILKLAKLLLDHISQNAPVKPKARYGQPQGYQSFRETYTTRREDF